MSAISERTTGETPAPLRPLLTTPWFTRLAAIALTSAFWTSGIDKALHFDAAVREVQGFGLPKPAVLAALTVLVQLGGSALVIAGRFVWLGAGALAVFTVLATLLAHAFWNAPPAERGHQIATFFEHVGLIGGFALAAIVAVRSRRD